MATCNIIAIKNFLITFTPCGVPNGKQRNNIQHNLKGEVTEFKYSTAKFRNTTSNSGSVIRSVARPWMEFTVEKNYNLDASYYCGGYQLDIKIELENGDTIVGVNGTVTNSNGITLTDVTLHVDFDEIITVKG